MGTKMVCMVWMVLVTGCTGVACILATTYFYSLSACLQFSFPFFFSPGLHCSACLHFTHDSLLREFSISWVALVTSDPSYLWRELENELYICEDLLLRRPDMDADVWEEGYLCFREYLVVAG